MNARRIYVCPDIYIYIYIYIYVCACVCVYIYIYMCVCVCARAEGYEQMDLTAAVAASRLTAAPRCAAAIIVDPCVPVCVRR
eukprot:NODE_6894_length_429_cov_89.660526_g5285_i0.p3 GENE.NODE_6894_length_429_cov_89.660526_g5285_i0~~NODE_6894_length_429_cov_89.660526_g5285_i0.p3  ORF type:complete len:82 (+),score=38.01 NODE_6894_length_429_cov_89.660526_g5285_i0:170-415(+)